MTAIALLLFCSFGVFQIFYVDAALAAPLEVVPDPEGEKALYRGMITMTLIESERLRMAKAYGIKNQDITDSQGMLVKDAKSRGIFVDLAGTNNATVVIGIGEKTIGEVDYSQIPPNFSDNRSWKVSLFTSDNKLYRQQIVTKDIVAFQIAASNNDQGIWHVQLDNTKGYFDEQIIFTLVLNKAILLNER